jgi:hypothetical protein
MYYILFLTRRQYKTQKKTMAGREINLHRPLFLDPLYIIQTQPSNPTFQLPPKRIPITVKGASFETKSVACDTLRARRVLPKATIYLSRRDASLAERFLYNRERSFLLYKKKYDTSLLKCHIFIYVHQYLINLPQ